MRNVGIVGVGMGEDCVALGCENLSEDLAEIAKSYNGDLELVRGLYLGCELELGFVGLTGINALHGDVVAAPE